MFQLAAGKALAERLGVELVIDSSYFHSRRNVARDFGLHHFNHGAQVSKTPLQPKGKLLAKLSGRAKGPGLTAYKETSSTYDPVFEGLPDNTYLDGYWQSERFFQDQISTIRQTMTFTEQPNKKNAEVLSEMANCVPVSLHIRRGDYISNAKFKAVHGLCDLEYYHKAVDLVAKKLSAEPVIYAFSDDPDWVAENLKLPFEVRYMRHNDSSTDFEDMRLMSTCHHHILANSSFSWWGAWLNQSESKIVVAPKRWFLDPDLQENDIHIAGWITL